MVELRATRAAHHLQHVGNREIHIPGQRKNHIFIGQTRMEESIARDMEVGRCAPARLAVVEFRALDDNKVSREIDAPGEGRRRHKHLMQKQQSEQTRVGSADLRSVRPQHAFLLGDVKDGCRARLDLALHEELLNKGTVRLLETGVVQPDAKLGEMMTRRSTSSRLDIRQ